MSSGQALKVAFPQEHPALQIAVRELATELQEAQSALERFAQDPADRASLEAFATHVHSARGALRIAEVYGGALLAEEMEQLADYVRQHSADGKADEDGLEALMRAMEQLPAYVERVASGGRDVPLALLPLLNDLRAARGGALLSEGTLLMLNLSSDEPARRSAPADEQDLAELARKLRPRFQLALLGWIRGEDVERNLKALGEIVEQLEVAAGEKQLFQLWWVTAAVLEALGDGGLEGSVSLKRLLGQVDREIRHLLERGESQQAVEPPVELLNNLLYYVARSSTSGSRVQAVRDSFRLGELLPVDVRVEQERETLSAPSVRLMKTVAAAIREDLTRVKDVLDIFVRQGATQVQDLAPQLDMLRKISDTLGVLGLGELRDRVQGEIGTLQAIVDKRVTPDDDALLRVAAALIGVEDGLDGQLVRLILPEAEAGPAVDGEPTDEEFLQVQGAVLRECTVNMARIKEAVAQSLSAPEEAQGLDQVPQLVRGITAGLLMLGRQRAVEAMERIGRVLGTIVRPDAESLAPARLEKLAEAIVSVEYYMEMLQAGRSEPAGLMERAEASLAELEPAGRKIVTLRPPRSAEPAEQPAAEPLVEPSTAATPAAEAPVRPAAARGPAVVDPEFLELFVEEARENITRLEALFPSWEQNPQDLDALKDLRRVFHTLKGSGRMVGAQRVGEFSWSIESLLNRVISQTLSRSPDIVEVTRQAVAVMPRLIDELESGNPADVDVAAIMARADALSGREATALPPVPPPVPAGVEAARETAATRPEMDPVLREIFRKETAGHITVVRDFLSRCSGMRAPHAVTEGLYRACHTLSGIAKTASVRQGIKVAEPMERYVRKLYESGHGLPAEGLTLLGDTMRALESVSDHVEEDTGFFADHGALVAGWHALERSLEADLARLTEAAERTVGEDWEEKADAGVEFETEFRPQEMTEPSLPVIDASEIDQTSPHEVLIPTPEPEPAAHSYEPEFDADIAAIFGEEASELLEQADLALSQWRRDRADSSRLTELKRLLHTVKGGARMAGIRSMGDLSHEMESFLASLESGAVAYSEACIDVLQETLDELHRMRDAACAGHRLMPAHALIERIRALGAAPAAPAEPVIEREPAQPVEVPLPEVEPPLAEATEAALERPVAAEPVAREAAEEAEPLAGEPEVAATPAIPIEVPEPTAGAVETEALVEGETEPAAPEMEAEAPAPEEESAAEEFAPASAEEPAAEAPAAEMPAVAEPPAWVVTPPEPVQVPPEALPETPPAIAAEAPAVPVLPGREPAQPADRHELARVDADLLDNLLNNAGEASIFRARVEQQLTSIDFNLTELGRTVTRLREQLRKLEMETEAQILFKHQEDAEGRTDFDPLELDRYSTIQQLSRALAESSSDVASIEGLLGNLNREAQNLLQQQGRVITELQNGLMRTRMVPFQRHVQRLARLVRQAALEAGKKVDLEVSGASGELDRQVLERMLPPFEHMLRNAVVHGIEPPAERAARGKPETGRIHVQLRREGAEVVITVEDDGAGLNVEAIRAKARQMGLLPQGKELTDEEALQLVLEPGFSTANRLTQQAGRGVGMDVVATEVKKLGGGLFIESFPGHGARFTIRLPFTLAITQALIVRVHDEFFALPVATVEGVARLPRAEVERHLQEEQPTYEYGGQPYRFQHLGNFVGSPPSTLPDSDAAVPVILVRAGEHSAALVTDELVGSREIVVKSLGPQVSGIRGVAGATILGDGRIVVILDIGALVRSEWRARGPEIPQGPARDDRIFALVVDDSITVRRVTQRLLERNSMRVIVARDGVEAMSLLQEHTPDVILLDIEMPRMDGYEVASQVRNDPRLADVPIIMITSRVGDKHRARAIELGIDDYLGKPYQESQLLNAIEPLVLARRRPV